MRAWNRWRLLWAYLRRKTVVDALPVEYIVETTAKCNIYCPMCPRETHRQPKEDMPDAVFDRLIAETRHTAEHMMLIGLGEPLLDRAIFDRIHACDRHGISALISTNGTLLDEEASRKLLATPLEHITLSMDGASAASYEFYRKGAKFERVRDNFVRFCELKRERKLNLQVVVQLVRMERNQNEVEEFRRFWSKVPGVDAIRIKEDETNLMRPGDAHRPADWTHPCHFLWRGAVYVKHNGDVYPCCQSYMLDGAPIGRVGETPLRAMFDSPAMREYRKLHVEGRAGEIGMCAKCRMTIPHRWMAAGSLVFHGRTVRRLLPIVERIGRRWMKSPAPAPESKPDLVQIGNSR
jgi:radical SAM protein with 4Fe4S-binding SPASM domain